MMNAAVALGAFAIRRHPPRLGFTWAGFRKATGWQLRTRASRSGGAPIGLRRAGAGKPGEVGAPSLVSPERSGGGSDQLGRVDILDAEIVLRKRERERERYIYIYIYRDTHTATMHTHTLLSGKRFRAASCPWRKGFCGMRTLERHVCS
jgi:hypothetical protein